MSGVKKATKNTCAANIFPGNTMVQVNMGPSYIPDAQYLQAYNVTLNHMLKNLIPYQKSSRFSNFF